MGARTDFSTRRVVAGGPQTVGADHTAQPLASRQPGSWHRFWYTIVLPILLTPLTVGGQAVIEGVMMRSPGSFAVAVRRRDRSIVVRERPVNNFLSRYRFFRWPLIRGAVVLLESVTNGIGALNFAADQAMLDEETPKAAGETTAVVPPVLLDTTTGGPTGASQGAAFWGTLAVSLVLGLALFVGLPHGLTYLVGALVPGGIALDSGLFHLVDGTFKLAVFVVYIVLIGRLEDIRRLFMYHGAEHKAVHTFEAGRELVVAEAEIMSTAHPRCGTSLVLWVVGISILVFAAAFPFFPRFFDNDLAHHTLAVLAKILLSFPIAGIAYELQRFAARHPRSRLVSAMIRPGMAMQSLTTREPSPGQLEVALTALRKVLWRERNREAAGVTAGTPVERYTDFAEAVIKTA